MCLDANRVVNANTNNLVCCICMGVFCVDCAQDGNGHTFCRKCILQSMSNGNYRCPIGRELINLSSLISASIDFKNILRELDVNCIYKSNGCNYTTKYENMNGMELHELLCSFSKVKCDNGCDMMIDFNTVNTHNCVKHLKELLLNERSNNRTERDSAKKEILNLKTLVNKLQHENGLLNEEVGSLVVKIVNLNEELNDIKSDYHKVLRDSLPTCFSLNQSVSDSLHSSPCDVADHAMATSIDNTQNSISPFKRLKRGKADYVEINYITPFSICNIQKDHLLIASNSTLLLLDTNFNNVKTIENIMNEQFYPRALATNETSSEIFILDVLHSKIIKTNVEFDSKNTIVSESLCDSIGFCSYAGISYYKQAVYLCNSFTCNIDKYSSIDLKQQNSFKLDYYPNKIEITNEFACIRNDRTIYFHDINDFCVKKKYERSNYGIIGAIDNHFYEYCDGTLYCYKQNGDANGHFEIENLDCSMINCKGQIAYFNNRITMCHWYKHKLILF